MMRPCLLAAILMALRCADIISDVSAMDPELDLLIQIASGEKSMEETGAAHLKLASA